MTLKEWQEVYGRTLSTLTPEVLEDWAESEKFWEIAKREAAAQFKEAEEEIEDQKLEIEELKARIDAGPEWGNCRRGCPPAYLNTQGYCSPECELGLKDIEHYRRQQK